MELSIDLRQVKAVSGIPWHILFYDARAGRLPAHIMGKSYRLPADVAAKIVNDPDSYLAWRKTVPRPRRLQVVYNGVVYNSVVALAKALNITREKAVTLIRRGEAAYVANPHVFR